MEETELRKVALHVSVRDVCLWCIRCRILVKFLETSAVHLKMGDSSFYNCLDDSDSACWMLSVADRIEQVLVNRNTFYGLPDYVESLVLKYKGIEQLYGELDSLSSEESTYNTQLSISATL